MLNSYSVAMLRDIWKDKTANFAIVTALAAVPLVGAMGLAVDFGRSVNAKSIAQDRADEAMLSVARQGPAGTDRSLFNFIQAAIADDTGLQNVTVTGRWTTVNEFTVDIEGKLPLSLARVLPVGQSDMTVKVSSTGRYKQATQKAKAPQTAQLDPEAGDYNKIDAYCFNKEKRASSTGGRSQFVSIADNGGTTYTATMPSCADGETISFNLHNVRNQRGAKQNWLNALFENYDYYTDTTTDPKTGAEVYNLGG
ncbi:TadE/TadG family type IV pilus assembly protein, partial [Aureimonas psammosilenae]|uniref:TadE/TadG family type IV pilus assembly protein n=1 Tax=Aureimonas psammosilenae TaxID=2495496 RepID=UPI001260A826